MPSLKDLRNRISSVKATRKITKAMQMVAASKLRRAQSAVEAARPYAERMEKVLGNIASTVTDVASAPKLLGGTGQDQVHLLVVCTAERGLCGAFNSSIVRLAREKINSLQAAGKTVKILCVGRKGYDQLRRQYEKQIVELIELRVKTLEALNTVRKVSLSLKALVEKEKSIGSDPAKQKQLADAWHKRLWENIPYVPVGQYDQPIIHRKNVSGLVNGVMVVWWGIDKS